jgi:hypothetical protein
METLTIYWETAEAWICEDLNNVINYLQFKNFLFKDLFYIGNNTKASDDDDVLAIEKEGEERKIRVSFINEIILNEYVFNEERSKKHLRSIIDCENTIETEVIPLFLHL